MRGILTVRKSTAIGKLWKFPLIFGNFNYVLSLHQRISKCPEGPLRKFHYGLLRDRVPFCCVNSMAIQAVAFG